MRATDSCQVDGPPALVGNLVLLALTVGCLLNVTSRFRIALMKSYEQESGNGRRQADAAPKYRDR